MKIIKNIAIISLAIFMLSCGIDDSKKYVLSPEEVLSAYINKDDILTPEKLANIILCKQDSLYQFVDLRTPHDFTIDHLEGAINIPSKDILEDRNLEALSQDKKIVILFCKSNCIAVNSYLMLKQLNYKNIRVALGGYDFINDHIVASYGIKTGVYDGEKPRFDFLRLVAGTSAPINDSIGRPAIIDVNPNKVIKNFDEECPDLN